MTVSTLSFFAVALLTFNLPANGFVYRTRDAIIIEESNSYHPFVVRDMADLYGAIPVHPHTGLMFGPPSVYPWLYQTNRPTFVDIPTYFKQTAGTCGAGPTKTLSYDEQRVVGGVDAEKNSWPSIVGLRFRGNFFCGGSLIAPNQVLTAAHCLDWITTNNLQYLTVNLGMHILKPTDAQETRTVSRVILHGGWNQDTFANDIALITLRTPVNYTSTISPVCLPPPVPSNSQSQYADYDAAIVGWGLTSEGGSTSNVLQQATVQTLTNAKCKESYGGVINSGMLCAAAPGKDTCQGDSGGPLFVRTTPGSPWTQVGIVSFGDGCANPNFPGVYTRVTAFRTWIMAHANI